MTGDIEMDPIISTKLQKVSEPVTACSKTFHHHAVYYRAWKSIVNIAVFRLDLTKGRCNILKAGNEKLAVCYAELDCRMKIK